MNYEQRIYNTVISAGLSDNIAKIITAQAKHESNNFKSNVFLKNNNLFGMKVPYKRKSPFISGKGTSAPANEGSTPYAKFNSVEDSVKDLLHWHKYNSIDYSKITNPVIYAQWLKSKNYYGDTLANYTNALLRHIKDITKIVVPFSINGNSSIIVLLLILSITVLFVFN